MSTRTVDYLGQPFLEQTSDQPTETDRPRARLTALQRELDHFEVMAQTTAFDPALHDETALWRALAAEVRAYLNPAPQQPLLGLETPPQEA